MAVSALTRRHQLQLVRARQTIERRVASRARRATTADIDAWWQRAAPGVLQLVLDGYDLTAELAAGYLMAHAREHGVGLDQLPRIEPDADQLDAALQVTGPVAFKQNLRLHGDADRARTVMANRLAGSAARLALGGARKMTLRTIDGQAVIVGYRRVARPGACDFCSMLAGRGAVYKSRQRAAFVGQSGRVRGTRQIGASYHDNCSCVVEPLYEVE